MDTSRAKRAGEPRLTIRIPPEIRRKLRLLAAQQDTSVQALVEPAIVAIAHQVKVS